MRLILLRHAIAADRQHWDGEDADRPLTRAGVKRLAGVLEGCRNLHRAEAIWTSPWLRARTTAELAAAAWKLPLTEVAWLAGGAATAAQRARHLRAAPDVVLVGHEPDLGELLGFLTGTVQVELAKAGLAVLKGEPAPGRMTLRALLTPKVVAALAGD